MLRLRARPRLRVVVRAVVGLGSMARAGVSWDLREQQRIVVCAIRDQ